MYYITCSLDLMIAQRNRLIRELQELHLAVKAFNQIVKEKESKLRELKDELNGLKPNNVSPNTASA